ncbi:BnaC03g75310D [Brassica napus]|uniref:BnaC03g75310D protein n=1 Tax=Brassica napus TaxID=3708 RepID=A0A078J503_BRANA|nr:BnaC03g75310D [Brassica napus]
MTMDEHNEPSDDAQRVAELQKQRRESQPVAVREYGPPGSKPSPQHGRQQEASRSRGNA